MASLSIIVPVYNVESYLRDCIDSLLYQKSIDMEIILVDDGSPDRCPEICDEYADRDSRIRVIHQKNMGLVEARRSGLKVAEGDYITFVDGDDWIEKDAYLKMISYAEYDADIVIAGLLKDQDGSSLPVQNEIKSGVYVDKEKKDKIKKLLERNQTEDQIPVFDIADIKKSAIQCGDYYTPGVMPSLCNKLIRRSMINQENLSVDPCVRMGEDAAVFYPLLYKAHSVVVDNGIQYYHYRINNGSMCNEYDDNYFQNAKKLIDGLYKNLASQAEAMKQLPYYVFFILEIGFDRLISFSSKKTVGEIISEIRNTCVTFNLSELIDKTFGEGILTRRQRKRAAALRNKRAFAYFLLSVSEKISGFMLHRIS
jgi:glycosyltransferase involved in cell wall biosynthesis